MRSGLWERIALSTAWITAIKQVALRMYIESFQSETWSSSFLKGTYSGICIGRYRYSQSTWIEYVSPFLLDGM